MRGRRLKQSMLQMAYSAFSYKQGSSFLHRCPAWVKILLIPIVSISVFYFSPVFALGLLALQTLVSFILKFTLREQLADLKAVLYYALLLIFAKLIGNVAANGTNASNLCHCEERSDVAIRFPVPALC